MRSQLYDGWIYSKGWSLVVRRQSHEISTNSVDFMIHLEVFALSVHEDIIACKSHPIPHKRELCIPGYMVYVRVYYCMLSLTVVHVGYRQVVAWHRPFCVDLQEATFSLLRTFLERYCDGFDAEHPPPPFPTKQSVLCAHVMHQRLYLS